MVKSSRHLRPRRNEKIVLSFWNEMLGTALEETLFKHKGITKLHEWQKECLKKHEQHSSRNLVYSVPTSGGKTLVAEILMLEEVLCGKRDCIFIVPFVSIVQEKVSSLSALALSLGFLVEEYAGSKGIYPPTKRRKKNSIYVCTIEKGSSLVNSLIEENRIKDEIGLVVIDELHLIGEPRRGALLENICIKLKILNLKVVGMSATIGNLKDLSTFLDAELYTHDFRPGSLKEFVKIENELFSVVHTSPEPEIEFLRCSRIETNKDILAIDPDGLGTLVREAVPNNSCLVFCQSKKNCENVAKLIVETIVLAGEERTYRKHKEFEKRSLIESIKLETNGTICPVLERTILFGIAYHHSGITSPERKLIEEAYSIGTINCICCTSTLAAGVNLPAQRVILRAPYVGSSFISKTMYKQMIGRAGRTGFAEKGESFLICKPREAYLVRELIAKPVEKCESQLKGEDLKTFILSCFFLKLISCRRSLGQVIARSFIHLCMGKEILAKIVEEALDDLFKLNVLIEDNKGEVAMTNLGTAIAKANISCETGLFLFEELREAQKKLVLIGDLHLLYLITPYTIAENIRPVEEVVASVYSSLNSNELYVASCLGLTELVVARLMMGRSPPKQTPTRVLEKFFTCLVLYQLWKGNDSLTVANIYRVDRGVVHNLLAQTTSYASAVIRFCESIQTFWPFAKLLSIFPDRLSYCCSADLLPLMELPAVKLGRAKQLHRAGFKTVLSIAKADPVQLKNCILHLPLKQAKQLINVAKLMVQTKYESLQEEAEQYRLNQFLPEDALFI